jgi:hypothetical protein
MVTKLFATVPLVAAVTIASPLATLRAETPQEEQLALLFPLKKGLKWELVDLRNNHKYTEEVLEVDKVNGLTCYEFGYNTFNPEGKCISEKRGTCYAVKSDAERIVHEGKIVDAVLVKFHNTDFSETETWYLPGKGKIKEHFWDTSTRDGGEEKRDWTRETIAFPGASSITIGKVILNKDTDEKEVSSESVEADKGIVTKFERSRTITREVSFSTKVGAGAEIEARIAANLVVAKGELTTRIKGHIEQETGEKLTSSETRKQTIEIDGKELPKAKIVWVDIYRTGTVEVVQDGKPYKVSFEFPIGTKLVVKKQ